MIGLLDNHHLSQILLFDCTAFSHTSIQGKDKDQFLNHDIHAFSRLVALRSVVARLDEICVH